LYFVEVKDSSCLHENGKREGNKFALGFTLENTISYKSFNFNRVVTT
jgi:hypothetical protein